MSIIPSLMLIICSEGYSCNIDSDAKYFPMPDWKTCNESAAAMTQTNGIGGAFFAGEKSSKRKHTVTAICVGLNEKSEIVSDSEAYN